MLPFKSVINRNKQSDVDKVILYTLSTILLMVFVICKGRGGWMSKPEQLQKNKRTMNIFQQEKLIAEKKKEIEARMAEKARMTSQNSSKTVSPR